jgi:hypothetical protein
MIHETNFRIYDGLDEFSPLIGQFCGIGQFPQSIVGKSGQSSAKKNSFFFDVYIDPFGGLFYTNIFL